MRKPARFLLFLPLVCSSGLLAQGDRGSITGTVTDPAGAVIANAAIEVRNSETGVASQTATTATGNYTIAQVPAGSYELSVTAAGFKKYTRPKVALEATQVVRLDVALEVGAANESITVSAEVYNGKNRTFFFFNREQYREFLVVNNVPITGVCDTKKCQ